MLTPFGPEIWLADGPAITAAAGFHYPTRMAVIRLAGDGLFIWSPIALTRSLQAAVNGLGPVGHLIAPNTLHHMAMADWQAAYPQAQLHAAPGLASKRPDLRIDATLGQSPADWSAEMDQLLIDTRITPEAVFFHHASRTAIFTDLLQQLPPGWFTGWRAIVARLDLMTAAEPSVPRKFRMAIKNRATLRRQIDQLLSLNPERLIIAHGPVIENNAAKVLRRAFAWAKP
jgi:hypothetical protein